MRPALKGGLLPVWRERDTLQVGVDPRRAVAVRQLGPAAAVISLLDGSRSRDDVIATAQAYGVPAGAANRVLGLLASAGLLDDFPVGLHVALPVEVRARLAPELATAALAYQDSSGGARVLARRRGAFVRVYSAGRVGACVATGLAAAGVGRVVCVDPVTARAEDVCPAGLLLGDVGAPRQDGAARAMRAAAPEVKTTDNGEIPDLVICVGLPTPELAASWRYAGLPHLALRGEEAIGVVGPLVLPGRSACLRCVDLRKTDLDPAWPKILAQAVCGTSRVTACDVVLAFGVAAAGCAQALLFLDGQQAPATLNGTLELVLPDWQWRRRTWAPHGDCACGAGRCRTMGM